MRRRFLGQLAVRPTVTGVAAAAEVFKHSARSSGHVVVVVVVTASIVTEVRTIQLLLATAATSGTVLISSSSSSLSALVSLHCLFIGIKAACRSKRTREAGWFILARPDPPMKIVCHQYLALVLHNNHKAWRTQRPAATLEVHMSTELPAIHIHLRSTNAPHAIFPQFIIALSSHSTRGHAVEHDNSIKTAYISCVCAHASQKHNAHYNGHPNVIARAVACCKRPPMKPRVCVYKKQRRPSRRDCYLFVRHAQRGEYCQVSCSDGAEQRGAVRPPRLA